MAYTTIDKPTDYFETVLYTGTENSNTISVGFEPDFTWIKRRNSSRDHQLFNSITGANTVLSSNLTSAEEGTGAGGWTPNSDGFVVHQHVKTNSDGDTYVGWNWKAETAFSNDASSTSVGTIDSTGSVNTDAGFSIVSYTGTGSAGTVKHGLSTTPSMIMHKRRDAESGWPTWHTSLGTNIVELNETGASQGGSSYTNSTAPTSSVFSIGTSGDINADGGTFIAYCFAEKQGYSKFSNYTGNGNVNGTFVYTGFKPAFVMVKNSGAAENWIIFDNKRPGRNLTDALLKPNTDTEETTTGVKFDLLSNGFKARVSDAEGNSSDDNFIYMAFAENPFVTSTGVPATAR